jgi:hypothetical protein
MSAEGGAFLSGLCAGGMVGAALMWLCLVGPPAPGPLEARLSKLEAALTAYTQERCITAERFDLTIYQTPNLGARKLPAAKRASSETAPAPSAPTTTSNGLGAEPRPGATR